MRHSDPPLLTWQERLPKEPQGSSPSAKMGDNAETNAYLEKHDLAGTISTLIAETLKKQPANPYKALVRDRLPLLSFLPSPIDG